MLRVTILVAGILLSLGGLLSWMLLRHVREGEQQYRHLLDMANDAVIITDVESGKIVDANRTAGELIGRPLHELIGMPKYELNPEEERQRDREIVTETIGRGRSSPVELHVVHASGHQIPVEVSTGLAVVAGRQVIQNILRDITERRRTELALAESRGRLEEEARISAALARVARELIASLDAPVLLERLCQLTVDVLACDSSHTWLWQISEEAFVKLSGFGESPEQREATRVMRLSRAALAGLLARLGTDDITQIGAAELLEPALESLTEHLGVNAALYMALRRGNDVVGFHMACYASRDRRFTSDQERIARGIAQLATMALDNARLVEELGRANRLRSEFVATMSHELRTPLNVILGFTDLLVENDFGSLTARQLDAMQRVQRNARELFELISSTLDMSRLESGRVYLDMREVAVNELLAEVAADVQCPRERPGLRLRWELDGEPGRITTDPLKLKVVLKNLVRNAIKFTPEGTVTVTARRLKDGVEFCVSDTGIGIPPDIRAIIFEPFRQGSESINRRYGGVGLGLHIVQRLLKLLRGTVTLDSEVGRGSRFRVWLPSDIGGRASVRAA